MLLRERVRFLIQKGEKKMNIARAAGKSIPTITRFVEGGTLEFNAALGITKEFFPNEEVSIINDFTDHTKLRNERTALEYHVFNGDKESAVALINSLKASGNRHDDEWAKMYEIEIGRMRENISPDEVIRKIESSYPETIEMKIYATILKAYCYFEKKKYDVAEMILTEVETRTSLVKNAFIRSSYFIRIGQALSAILLKKNDVINCRKYSKYISNNMPSSALLASVYNTLGNSYLFENPKKAIAYLEKSRELCIKSSSYKSQRVIENSINFVQNLHGLEPSYLKLTDEIGDIHSNAFYHIKKGNADKALELLNRAILKPDNHSTKGFHYYYRGELTGNDDYYFESINEFKEVGDKFHCRLAADGLRKKGHSELMLKTLIK